MLSQALLRLSVLASLTVSTIAQQSQPVPQSSPTGRAPEIDVALAGGAIALVLAGVFIFTAVKRKKLARV